MHGPSRVGPRGMPVHGSDLKTPLSWVVELVRDGAIPTGANVRHLAPCRRPMPGGILCQTRRLPWHPFLFLRMSSLP